MMRYLKRLADLDYALDRGMIPLGSCTMKLNAATEMAAVTWPEFASLHPFAPAADVAGYARAHRAARGLAGRAHRLRRRVAAAERRQPGRARGAARDPRLPPRARRDERDVCLIPSSAHGTNAASAVLAGLRVVVVACDEGNVDLDDLRAKIAEHEDRLAAIMITYPSTHGVYEHEVPRGRDAVHDAGGQVYIDGANLNALVGVARSGEFGGDVSHLNLHKTFCIPHGGGGPGVGPVGGGRTSRPYLPGHPLGGRRPRGRRRGGGPVWAAPFGRRRSCRSRGRTCG